MVAARYHVGAALLALTACSATNGQSGESMERVRFTPGMNLREMVSERLYKQLSPQIRTDGSPFVVTIGTPHVVKLELGSEEIELHPGGYNSMTNLISGYWPRGLGDGTNGDYNRIGTLDTDTGSELLTRGAARDLAIRLCAVAEKGLGTKSSTDPAQVIDNPKIPATDLTPDFSEWDAPFSSIPRYRGSTVCVVENADVTFIIRYSGPDDILSKDSPRKDEEAFRLNVSVSQAIKE